MKVVQFDEYVKARHIAAGGFKTGVVVSNMWQILFAC